MTLVLFGIRLGGPNTLPRIKLVLCLAWHSAQIPRAWAVPDKPHEPVSPSSSNHTLSPYDKCTLGVCGAVLLTCALALIAQSCRISALIIRRAQQWKQEEHQAKSDLAMADLEGGGNPQHGIITRYATRYGGIVEQVMDVNGVRKVVLVVNARLPTSEAQDAYAHWFQSWCHRREVASSDAGEGASDEMTPLIGVEPETPRYLDEVVNRGIA